MVGSRDIDVSDMSRLTDIVSTDVGSTVGVDVGSSVGRSVGTDVG